VPEHPPVRFRASVGFDDSKCDSGHSSLENIIDKYIFKFQCTRPMDPEHGFCQLGCDNEEPELEKSFRPYSGGKYTFDHLWKHCQRGTVSVLIWINDNIPRYHICGDRDHVQSRSLFKSTSVLLSAVLCSIKLPGPLLFAIDQQDWAVPHEEGHAPGWIQPLPAVLRYVGVDSHPTILLPTNAFAEATTHCMITSSSSKSDFLKVCRSIDESPEALHKPWNTRSSDTIFWRGSSTGVPLSLETEDFLPRPAIIKKLWDVEGYDVGFVGGQPPAHKAYHQFFETHSKPPISQKEYTNYKFILHADGHTASWGLAQKLSTNTLVILIPSIFGYREFYYKHLKEWEHYLPMESDLSNAKEIRDWLRNEEGEKIAGEIARRARHLIVTRLRPEATYCYLSRLLISLQGLQKEPANSRALQKHGIPTEKFQVIPQFEILRN